MEKYQELIKDFLKKRIISELWYQDIEGYLKAIILYGSVAKGTNRSDSDIDLLFILPIDVEKKYTKGEYVYQYNGKEYNIVIRSIEKLREIAGGKPDLFQAEIFRKSIVVWKKDDEVSKLIFEIAGVINKAESYLGKIVEIKIDRPKGSKHPKHNFIYDSNYGFVPNTLSPDGEELDAYVLEIDEPIENYKGKCVAVIHRTNDDDDKLVIIPKEIDNISDEEIRKQTNFQENFFKSVIIR